MRIKEIYGLAKRMKELEIPIKKRRECIQYVYEPVRKWVDMSKELYSKLEESSEKGLRGDDLVRELDQDFGDIETYIVLSLKD